MLQSRNMTTSKYFEKEIVMFLIYCVTFVNNGSEWY